MNAIEIVFSSFWTWIGAMLFVYMVTRFLTRLWLLWLRSRNLKANGWPPAHLDADGDFQKADDDEKKESRNYVKITTNSQS